MILMEVLRQSSINTSPHQLVFFFCGGSFLNPQCGGESFVSIEKGSV